MEAVKHFCRYFCPVVVASTVQLFLAMFDSCGSATKTYCSPFSPFFKSTSCGNPWKYTCVFPSSKIKFQIGIIVSLSVSISKIGKVIIHLSFTST